MAVGERGKVLFVGAVLFGFGTFRFRVDAHLLEEYRAELTRGVHVQVGRSGELSDAPFEGVHLHRQFAAVFGQTGGVYLDAGQLDVGQHVDERFLYFAVELFEPGARNLGP